MKLPLKNIKLKLAQFPMPFWVSFYLLCFVVVLPLLAYLGTFSRGADSPPIVATQTAASVTQSTASLNGFTSPKGVTERGFQYGTTTSYGETVQDASIINYAFSAKWGSSGTGDGQFGTAYGVAVDSNDNVYISDISNNNIQKFDSNGNFITKWGSTGTGDGQFRGPYGIDIDSSDNIYIGENINDRIQKFDSNGNFITKWGSTGTGDGQFNGIQGLGVAADGTVYVADSGNNDRIQKFDSNGNFITKWGSTGTGDGQFNNPVNATVDSSGNVYVADFNNNRIQKFDSNGTFITKWVPGGGPYDLDVDSNGNIAVIEGGGDQVEKFDSNGNFINKWGTSGSGDGQFNVGVGIAINSNDDVYTSDFLVDRIQKFTGIITADISSLNCGTTYHYRAYATNSYGTSYGDDQSFTTELCPGDFNPVTFDQCGTQASWVVPDGVNQIAVEVAGAKGGGAYTEPGGGLGGRVETILQVTPGQTLYLNPGCQGNTGVDLQTSTGGWNGGGTGGRGGGGGGGAADIRIEGTALSDRVIVAGGGGGMGADLLGGSGGGNGGVGGNVDGATWLIENGAGEGGLAESSADPGYAGNQIEGGYGGNGTSGSLGLGGDGGNSYLQTQSRGGGGGGGGYYGGGGGSTFIGDPGGGGGGGSSYANQAITSATTFSKGVNSGDGYISLTPVEDPFIFRVKTDISANSGDTQFTVPTNPGYVYNFNVDCNNDGTLEHTNQTGNVTCNYGVAGEYDIAIYGTYPHMSNASIDPQKIIDVKQWGAIAWQDMRYMFFNADNLASFTATDEPDLSNVLDMEGMFSDTDFFNANIESWDVNNVTDFSRMFSNALSFNQPLDGWNTSSAIDTSFMFEDSPFNQPLNSWDVSNVTNMSSMFQGANSFNQPLGNWNTVSVVEMSGMFYQNTAFNQDISSWNTSNVISINQMFSGATSFNQPLNSWDVSSVITMQLAFFGATSFNQPLNNWDITSADSLQGVFALATSFNQDLSSWNTSNVANMNATFTAASSFDQSLAAWDVSSVADMTYMFGDAGGLAPGTSGLSTANYDATLIAWSQQNLQSGVTFDAGISQYCNAEVQRQSMIDLDAWTINDSGKNCAVLTELPSAPRNLRTSNITMSSLRLDWDPPASDGGTEILAYQVQYRTAGASTWINAPLQAATPTAHVFINLNSDTGYEFRVAAINAVGQGPFSNPISATTLSQTVTPTQPEDPTDPPVTPVNPEVPATDGETNTPAPNTPTYSRPRAQQALPMKQSTLGAVMGPLVNFVRPVPRPVAQAIPWTILLLLIAIACLYAYSTYQEHKRRQAFEKLRQRFAVTLAARATFLEITSHYIKTPITKMQGVIELLQSGVIGSATPSSNKTVAALGAESAVLTIPEDTIVKAQQAIRSMTEHANELLDEGQALTGRQQAKMQIIDKYSKLSILTRPGFWLPVLVVVTLTIMANFIFIQADKYEASVITVVAQGLIGIVGIIAVAVSLYFLRASRIQSSLAKQQSEIEAEILTRQQRLIEGAVGKFDDDLIVLNGLNATIRRYPKTEAYSDGLEEFQKIVSQFKKLDELSRIVPGISWNVPIGKTINSVVSTLGALAEQRGVTIKANSSDKAVNVAVSQDALTHLIAAPLKNALLASGRGTSVEISVNNSNKEAEVVIRDTGPGIPADKLASIFRPFNSATDTKRFSNTGLGLDLYLAKVITEQYGADIKIESKIGEGTVIRILLPVSRV